MANNLLVDWLNKKPNLQKSVQSTVNNNTASNMKTLNTPTLNTRNLNLRMSAQPAPQPTVPTIPQIQSPTNNMPSAVVSQIAQQNTQPKTDLAGRFIWFPPQQQQPQQRLGQRWGNPFVYIPNEANQLEISNKAEENRFRTQETALLDLQGDLYKWGKILSESEIKRLYPEFKDNMSAIMEFQKEVLPIVKSGKWVSGEQISQFYNELIQPKNLQDVEWAKAKSEKDNKMFSDMKTRADKLLTKNSQLLSQNWQKYLADWQQLGAIVDDYKQNYSSYFRGNPTDYDIVNYLAKNEPQVQQLLSEIENLGTITSDWNYMTQKDWDIINKNGFFAKAQERINDAAGSIQGGVQKRNDKIETGTAGRWLNENLNINRGTADTLLWVSQIPWNMFSSLAWGIDRTTTSIGRLSSWQSKADDTVVEDVIKTWGGVLETAFNTVWAIPTTFFHLINQTPMWEAATDLTFGNLEEKLDDFQSWKMTNSNNQFNQWYNWLDEQTKADLLNEEIVAILRVFHKWTAKVKKLTDFEINTAKNAINDVIQQKFTIDSNSATFKAKVEKWLAEWTMKVSKDWILTDRDWNNIGKVKVKQVGTKDKVRYVVDKVISANRAAWNAKSLWELNPEALPDNRTTREKIQSKINDVKEWVNQAAFGAWELAWDIYNAAWKGVDMAKQWVETAKEWIDNLKNKVTTKKQTEIKAQETTPATTQAWWSQPKKWVVSKVVWGVTNVANKVNEKVVDPLATKVAEWITSTTAPQDKIFKALNPSINVLSRKKWNYNTMRKSADRANELIIEYGHTPTNSAEYYDAIQKTKKEIWNNWIQQGLDEHKYMTIDAADLVNPVREALKSEFKEPLESLKWDVKLLERELKALEDRKIVNLETLEAKKQQINAILEYWLPPDASQIYEKWMRELNKQIWIQEDRMISEIPWQFQQFKRDYGALLAIQEDAQKLMIKDMKAKLWGNLIQNWSRIEGLTKMGKSLVPWNDASFWEWATQIILWESLWKVKEPNFLIQSWFWALRDQYWPAKWKPEWIKIKKKPPTPRLEDKRTDIEKGKIAELDMRSEENKKGGYSKNKVTAEKTAVTEKKAEPKAEVKEQPKEEVKPVEKEEAKIETKNEITAQKSQATSKGKTKSFGEMSLKEKHDWLAKKIDLAGREWGDGDWSFYDDVVVNWLSIWKATAEEVADLLNKAINDWYEYPAWDVERFEVKDWKPVDLYKVIAHYANWGTSESSLSTVLMNWAFKDRSGNNIDYKNDFSNWLINFYEWKEQPKVDSLWIKRQTKKWGRQEFTNTIFDLIQERWEKVWDNKIALKDKLWNTHYTVEKSWNEIIIYPWTEGRISGLADNRNYFELDNWLLIPKWEDEDYWVKSIVNWYRMKQWIIDWDNGGWRKQTVEEYEQQRDNAVQVGKDFAEKEQPKNAITAEKTAVTAPEKKPEWIREFERWTIESANDIVEKIQNKSYGEYVKKDSNWNTILWVKEWFGYTTISVADWDWQSAITAHITKDDKWEKVHFDLWENTTKKSEDTFSFIMTRLKLPYIVWFKEEGWQKIPTVLYKKTWHTDTMQYGRSFNWVAVSKEYRLKDTDLTISRNEAEQAEQNRIAEENRAENQRVKEKLEREEQERKEKLAQQEEKRKSVQEFVDEQYEANLPKAKAKSELTKLNKDADRNSEIAYYEWFPENYDNMEIWELLDILWDLDKWEIREVREHGDTYSYWYELNRRQNEKGRWTNDYRTHLNKYERDYLDYKMWKKRVEADLAEEARDMKENPENYASEEQLKSLFKEWGTTVKTQWETLGMTRQGWDSRAATFTNTILDIIESNGGLKDWYLKVEHSGLEPLYIEDIWGWKIAIGQTYIQEWDVMFDPEVIFHVEDWKLVSETLRNDGMFVYDSPIKPNDSFFDNWNATLREFVKETESQTTTEITGEKTAVTEKKVETPEPKNKITKSPVDELMEKNWELEYYIGDKFMTYRYPWKSLYTPEWAPIMEWENIKMIPITQWKEILENQIETAFNNWFKMRVTNGEEVNGQIYDHIERFDGENWEPVIEFYRTAKHWDEFDYAWQYWLKEFLDMYWKDIKELQSVAKSENQNIIGTKNTLTTKPTTNEQKDLWPDNKWTSKGVLWSDRPLSMNERETKWERDYSREISRDLREEQLDNDAISKGQSAWPAIWQQQRVLTRTEARAINQNAKDILAKHNFSTNPKDYTPEEINILRQYEWAGWLTKAWEDTTWALDQFYTPQAAIDAVWHLVDMYKDESNRYDVLEPTVWTGRFIRDHDNERYEGHEIDETPWVIAQILHPKADIHVWDFENQFMDFTGRVPQDFWRRVDIVVWNPPYSVRMSKQQKAWLEPKIKRSEEFFIKKWIDVLTNWGMLAMVVPSTFLRNPMDYAKEEILKQATLVDAYRLPEGVFPYTQVGTDIIVFKKNKSGSESIADNKWFEEHPEKVLGVEKERINRFGNLEKYVDWGTNPLEMLNAIYEDAKAVEPTPEQQAKEYSPTTTIESKPIEQKAATPVIWEKNKVTAKPAVKKTTTKPWTKIDKQTIIKWEKTDLVDTVFWEWDLDERLLEYAKKTDINWYVEWPALQLVENDPKNLNFYKYHAVTNDMYFAGNIREKLDTLEREKADLSEAQYKKQKEWLLAVMPEQYTVENHPYVSPLDTNVMDMTTDETYESYAWYNQTETRNFTVKDLFLDWFRNNVSYDTMNKDLAREYINGQAMRSGRSNTYWLSDKEKAAKLRHEKSVVMEQTNQLFNEWLWTKLDRKMQEKIVEKFNKENRSYVLPKYDKMPLPLRWISETFNGDKFVPKEAQIEAINFLLSKGAWIAALWVGRWKTIVGTIATREAQLRWWNKRPMIICPAPTLYAQWVRTIREQYPDWEIVNLWGLTVDDVKRLKRDLWDDPKEWIKDWQVAVISREWLANGIDFKPRTRAELESKLKDVMEDKWKKAKKTARAEESLKKKIEQWLAPWEWKADKHIYHEWAEFLRTTYNRMLDMDKEDFLEYFKDAVKEENKDLPEDVALADAEALRANRPIFIEDLWIDHLTVDEMHNFKNVFASAKMDEDESGVKWVNRYGGIIQGSSSERWQKLYLASQYVMENNWNRNVFWLTATPFNNQPIEIYNMLSMVGKNELEKMWLTNINDFFSKFAEFKEGLAPNAAWTELEYKFVMKDFANKRDLQRLITQFVLFKWDSKDLVRPEYRLRTPVLEMSDLQKETQRELEIKALENADKWDVLSATNWMIGNLITPFMVQWVRTPTGRKDFIDNSSKLKFIAESIKNLRDMWNEDWVFIYMPKWVEFHETFREALANITGTPKEKIWIINTNTKARKDEIAQAFRDWRINILIWGKNTAEWIDLQDKWYMTFITDVGRNTTERTQVDGRVWRQGNNNNHVLSVVPLMRDSADIIYMGKADQKWSRINNALDTILYGGEWDLSPEEAMTNLMTDPTKKAKSLLNIQKQDIDKEIYGVNTQMDRLKEMRRRIEDAEKSLDELEKRYEQEKAVGRTWNLDHIKREIKDTKKAQERLEKYLQDNGSVPTKEELDTQIEKLEGDVEKFEEKKKEIKEADTNGLLEKLVKDITEEYNRNNSSIKDYNSYLDDLKQDYKESHRFGSKAELKQYLEDKKNNVLGTDKNKVTTQAARTSRPSISMNVEEREKKNSTNVVVNPNWKQPPLNTKSKNWKKVVVNAKWEAADFYHGTPNWWFEQFDMASRGTSNDLSWFGDFGKGFYFTTDAEEAKNYATLNKKVESKAPEVYKVNLYMDNPLDFRKYYDAKKEIEAVYRKSVDRQGNYLGSLNKQEQAELDNVFKKYWFADEDERNDFEDLIDSLWDNWWDWDMAAHGYDGVIWMNWHGEERVVFDKDQIEIIGREKQEAKSVLSNDKNRVTSNAMRAYRPQITMKVDDNWNPVKKNKSKSIDDRVNELADKKGITGNRLKKMKGLNKTIKKNKWYHTPEEKEIYNLKNEIIMDYVIRKWLEIDDLWKETVVEIRQGKTRVHWHLSGNLYRKLKKKWYIKKRQ